MITIAAYQITCDLCGKSKTLKALGSPKKDPRRYQMRVRRAMAHQGWDLVRGPNGELLDACPKCQEERKR